MVDEEKVLTKEDAERIEAVFFEDDERIKLRDGKVYKIPPSSLVNARRLMKLLKTINIDAILLNFSPSDEEDTQKEDDLFEVLSIAFENYPDVDREYLAKYVDIVTATEIIEILIGLNGLKKVEASVSSGIVDTETNEYLDWGDLFFMLHKHCNLNKWDIYNYTLPQITELLKKAQKNIRFEIEASLAPFGAFMGGTGKDENNEGSDITDDDLQFINDMALI